MTALLLAVALAAAEPPKAYVIYAPESEVRIHVGKAGLLRFAGHEHEVAATSLSGRVLVDASDVTRSSVSVRFDAKDLRVLAEGESEGDVPKIEERMLSLLEVVRFPRVTFESSSVTGRPSGDGWDLSVTGTFSLHGVERTLQLPLRATLAGDALVARGVATLRHGDYGLVPVTVAGVVKVKEEIVVKYKIVAHPEP